MKLLLDMGLSPRTARYLRENGHEAVHLWETGQAKLPDDDIVRKASGEGRVLVTFDLDFSRILALQRLAHPSVILFRLQAFKTDQLNQMLLHILAQNRKQLEEGAIIVVDPDRTRTRSLPIW